MRGVRTSGAANQPAQGAVNPACAAPAWDYVHTEYSAGGHRWHHGRADHRPAQRTEGARRDAGWHVALHGRRRARRLSRSTRTANARRTSKTSSRAWSRLRPAGPTIANDNTQGKQGIYISLIPKRRREDLVDRKTPGFDQSERHRRRQEGRGVFHSAGKGQRQHHPSRDGKG